MCRITTKVVEPEMSKRTHTHTQTSNLRKSWKYKNWTNKRQKNKTQGTKAEGKTRTSTSCARTRVFLKMHFFLLRFLKHFHPQTGCWCNFCTVSSVRPRWWIPAVETPALLSTHWKHLSLQTLAFSSLKTLRWEKKLNILECRTRAKGEEEKKKKSRTFFYLSWRIDLDHVKTQRGERRRTVNKTSTQRAVGPAQTSVHSTLFSQGGDLWCISSFSHPLDTFITK